MIPLLQWSEAAKQELGGFGTHCASTMDMYMLRFAGHPMMPVNALLLGDRDLLAQSYYESAAASKPKRHSPDAQERFWAKRHLNAASGCGSVS